jgi:hypothetical protein
VTLGTRALLLGMIATMLFVAYMLWEGVQTNAAHGHPDGCRRTRYYWNYDCAQRRAYRDCDDDFFKLYPKCLRGEP